jgi:hypothetical protein
MRNTVKSCFAAAFIARTALSQAQTRTHHGFNGTERDVVAQATAWILVP